MSNILPTGAQERKDTPVYSGFLNYFPMAIAEIARVSKTGNDQHNPGRELFWDRSKSGDELDALTRHLLQAGTFDVDGLRHSAKVAWRAMANLEKELESVTQKDHQTCVNSVTKSVDDSLQTEPETRFFFDTTDYAIRMFCGAESWLKLAHHTSFSPGSLELECIETLSRYIEVEECHLDYLNKPEGDWVFKRPVKGNRVITMNGVEVVAPFSYVESDMSDLFGYRWVKKEKNND